jgi:DNA-binding transcriptional LysR family regulator
VKTAEARVAGTVGRITLWGIEVFVATAEEASISSAARRLGASAATVSQQLTNLEAAVGVTLLNRGERPVTLTPAGAMFLRRANAILNEADQARAELALADLSRLTRFRLGVIEDFDAEVTPRLLTDLGAQMRNCQFLLETGASHRLYDALEARAVDVVIASEVGDMAEGMEVHPLMEEPFVAAVPRGTALGDDSLRRLRRMPFIRYTSRHYMGRLIAAHLAGQNVTLPHRFELDSYHAIMAMVADGAGWTILTPLGCMRAQRFRACVDIVPLPLPPLTRRIVLVARRGVLGNLPAQMAGRMRELLAEHLVGPAVAEWPWLDGSMRVTEG